MYFDADGGRDATSGFVGLGVGHMFGQRGSCVVAPGFFAGHRVGFDFHRAAGDENPDFARFPCVRIPGLGRRQRNVDQDRSFQQRRGIGRPVFFRARLWLLYQATGSTQWLTAAQTWTTPLASQASSVTRVDPTDIGFIIGTSSATHID